MCVKLKNLKEMTITIRPVIHDINPRLCSADRNWSWFISDVSKESKVYSMSEFRILETNTARIYLLILKNVYLPGEIFNV